MGKGNAKRRLCNNGNVTKFKKGAQGSLKNLYKIHKERLYGRATERKLSLVGTTVCKSMIWLSPKTELYY